MPYSIAEVVSELLFHGRTVEQVASFDDYQLMHLFRRRKEDGTLVRRVVRDDLALPPGVEVDADGMRVVPKGRRVSFQKMFIALKMRLGMTLEQAQAALDDYRKANPQLGAADG